MSSVHKVVGSALIALAVVGCQRNEREREGASNDRNDTLFVVPPPLPNTEPQLNAPAAPVADESAMQQTEASEPPKAAEPKTESPKQQTAKKQTAKRATAPADAERAGERSEQTTARTADEPAADEPVGTATITSGVLIVPFADTTEKPSEAEPAPAPPPAAGAGSSPDGYTNRSTPLGNGQSGMYTGGQGTYGGRATWGTGAGTR